MWFNRVKVVFLWVLFSFSFFFYIYIYIYIYMSFVTLLSNGKFVKFGVIEKYCVKNLWLSWKT
jgi:hypothetical protein